MARVRIVTPSRFRQIEDNRKPAQPEAPSRAPKSLALTFKQLQRISKFAEENGMAEAPLHIVVSRWRKINPLG